MCHVKRLFNQINMKPIEIIAWSYGGERADDAALNTWQTLRTDGLLPFTGEAKFYKARIRTTGAGALVLQLESPRPIRIRAAGERVLDEPLAWRSFQRKVMAALVLPVESGTVELLIEVGARPRHPSKIDDHCPSRRRDAVMNELAAILPDVLRLEGHIQEAVAVHPTALRFLPGQFVKEGWIWQEILIRPAPGSEQSPGTAVRSVAELPPVFITVSGPVVPDRVHDGTTDEERRAGLRHLYIPVASSDPATPVVRKPGPETRPEPRQEVVAQVALRVECPQAVELTMPVFESLGRKAPQREYRALVWPDWETVRATLPEPVLPPDLIHFKALYEEAWQMLLRLVRTPRPESGLPNSYIGTGTNFPHCQFVWDTSFTAMAAAYGWRAIPAQASLDLLYSRQFDGGYLHREHDVRDGTPLLYEPDFSPNPPIMAIAEWKLACLTGDRSRLMKVYPALTELFEWLEANRQLPDGTFWTTGLANGLDNSPSLGEGYPDLTAQMAHHAEMLGLMADTLGRPEEAADWRAKQARIGAALNARLWSESMTFYSTSLPGGGHNPNKVVTGFWPLWAGVVPPERVEHLAAHLKDPASFWRHHPVPSLAADSPHFKPLGQYWLGSTWAPTNYATIKGFQRAGRQALALETTLRHLQCLHEVFKTTGSLWENYCSEAATPGNWSAADYCWTALGPIALLFEVIIGLEPDALNRRLVWTPPMGLNVGAKRYPLGQATVDLQVTYEGSKQVFCIKSDFPFTLEVRRDGECKTVACAVGTTWTSFSSADSK